MHKPDWTSSPSRQRLAAGGLHLTLSSLIAVGAACLVFLVWYPAPLAETQGIRELVITLITVDVVIGPLLTTAVFDRSKKFLAFDLAVIASLQIAALAYGLHAIFIGRPVFVVFNIDRFDVVQGVDIDRASLNRAGHIKKLPWSGPQIVGARLPQDLEQRNTLTLASAYGTDLPQLPEWFVPYNEEQQTVLARALPLRELKDVNNLDAVAWKLLVDQLKRPEVDLRYLPLRGKVTDGAVVVDAYNAEVVRILPLQPRWKTTKKEG